MSMNKIIMMDTQMMILIWRNKMETIIDTINLLDKKVYELEQRIIKLEKGE